MSGAMVLDELRKLLEGRLHYLHSLEAAAEEPCAIVATTELMMEELGCR